MNAPSNMSKKIQQWMKDVAESKKPKKKLVFDPKSKQLIVVDSSDPRADESLEFTPEEATRF